MKSPHSERAHSKFSASGAERWFNCQGSVALSEGVKSRETPASLEGVAAHEHLEKYLRTIFFGDAFGGKIPRDMRPHVLGAGSFITEILVRTPQADPMVEDRIYLDFIHPEAFGTFDSAIVQHFGTLHVFDFKYGKHHVSPVENLQMQFYGIGLAHKFHWNFRKVRLWIIQPRVKGYDGPSFWEMPILELKKRVQLFKDAVDRVENEPGKYKEGNWCFFCAGKSKCPLKTKSRNDKARKAFLLTPIT